VAEAGPPGCTGAPDETHIGARAVPHPRGTASPGHSGHNDRGPIAPSSNNADTDHTGGRGSEFWRRDHRGFEPGQGSPADGRPRAERVRLRSACAARFVQGRPPTAPVPPRVPARGNPPTTSRSVGPAHRSWPDETTANRLLQRPIGPGRRLRQRIGQDFPQLREATIYLRAPATIRAAPSVRPPVGNVPATKRTWGLWSTPHSVLVTGGQTALKGRVIPRRSGTKSQGAGQGTHVDDGAEIPVRGRVSRGPTPAGSCRLIKRQNKQPARRGHADDGLRGGPRAPNAEANPGDALNAVSFLHRRD